LRDLDISATCVKDFEHIFGLRLDYLNLQHTWINASQLEAMSQGPMRKSLRWLNIKDTPTAGVECTEAFEELDYVSHNSITEFANTTVIEK
jgi:hypothetical protein